MKFLQSFDPATGAVVWQGEETTPCQLEQSIQMALKAAPSWANRSLDERMAYLKSYEERLLHHQGHLAEVISKETGKPLWDAKGEVAALIQKISLSYTAYKERCPESNTLVGKNSLHVEYRPHGAVAVFGPFNFPMHLPNGHIVPALLAGNTVLFKPSEKTPASGEALYRCFMEADLPEGVLQIVQGGKETGQALASHPSIAGLFFTGSITTGLQLSRLFGDHPEKILALELGGNNPLIVSSFEDPKACAYLAIQSAFLTSGQRCTAARRLILIRNEANHRLLQLLIKMTEQVRVGSWTTDPEPFMGPLIDSDSAKKVLNAYKDLLKQGAVALKPLEQIGTETPFLKPALVDVTSLSNRKDEEIFGPLLQIIWVDDLEAALKEANTTRFGLSSGLVSSDPYEWHYFKKNIRAGIVNWNAPLTGASSKAPFGGIGLSGNHRPSAYAAADYCSYPVASLAAEKLELPINPHPGIVL